jgi:sugar O-acyltransferase (sialic acid O-acetyltransferase NeuD family)
MQKRKKLIIFGDKAYAEVAFEYFTHDSDYEVVVFTAEKAFLTIEKFCGLSVVPFEGITSLYPPSECDMFIAIVYGQLNRIREKIYHIAKNKGYRLATYVSSHSFVWHNVKIGDNCFIFEDNTIQPFVEIKNNVIVWSGNHIGHGSIIEDHCFLSSHTVISGSCRIGHHSFIGVNSTIGNHVNVGSNSWISPGAIITRDIPDRSLVKGAKSEVRPLNEEVLFNKLSTVQT